MSEEVPGKEKKEKKVSREEAPSVEPVNKQTWAEASVEEVKEGAEATRPITPKKLLAECEGGCSGTVCESCYGTDRCDPPS
jgi:hypothetical protein